MARDLIYYFDKLSFRRYEIGEIQSDFNMSFVIDGTKDSAKVEVFSFNENVIEPYTIIWHEKTNTWWIVSNDRVTRLQNDVGFAYIHELELYGAIELLNARDLTDCGFNDNTYTMEQFLQRLFSLSNFEYKVQTQTSINLNKMVDYIKTFENYTLLSAVREFLDSYNSSAKLTFNTMEENGYTYIDVRVGKSNTNVVNGIGAIETFADGSATAELELDDMYSVDSLYEEINAAFTIVGSLGTIITQEVIGSIYDSFVDNNGHTWALVNFDIGQPFIDLLPNGESVRAIDLEDFAVYLKTQGVGANLIITPKTGDYSLESHDSSHFDYTKEIKTMNKSSFGTCVVSNAENVISTQHKIYPSTGAVRLSATSFKIDYNNALLRLPSKVFKGLVLKCHTALPIENFADDEQRLTYYPTNEFSIESLFTDFIDYVRQNEVEFYYNQFVADLNSKKDLIIESLRKATTISLYNGNKIDPTYNNGDGRIVQGPNIPYLAQVWVQDGGTYKLLPLIFVDKATKDLLPKVKQGIAWERGSDKITGFEILHDAYINNLLYTDYQNSNNIFYSWTSAATGRTYKIKLWRPEQAQTYSAWLPLSVKETWWSIEYIPMADVKVKIDNDNNKRDVQLYNQNGRITDNVALSKLLNSYSKEISSDNVTRYMGYHNFNDIPKIGSFVYFGNVPYVINNISMDFVQNESRYDNDFAYYIECEFTMSKYVATKSLMVNPNTNIRDYGIPQNFNVKRKQVYRDYYELSYYRQSGANKETPYFATGNVFSFGISENNLDGFIGVIKLGYRKKVEASYQWYYQLETTNYYLNKMLYIILDFNDNNIIGYGSQNTVSAFDISKVFDSNSWLDIINTPISYVDDDGKVENIDLLLCSNEQLTDIYNEYQNETAYTGNTSVSLYNYSVFIPKEIYEKALLNHNIKISEPSYKKDAIEVPVFEYACQIEDSNDVLIGDNILAQHSGFIYFYTYIMADEGQTFTQENAPLPPSISYSTVYDAVKFSYLETSASKYLDFEIYERATYDSGSNAMNYAGGPLQFTKGRDYAIYRIAKNFATGEEKKELMLIIHKLPDDGLYTNECVRLTINHYKLK